MEPERWEQIVALYEKACEQDPATRGGFVARASQGDDELCREVQSLLDQDVTTPGFLEKVANWSSESRPPTYLGAYRIIGLIGEGGMGVVYEAEQENPRRIVALKVVKPGLAIPEVLRRFERESHVLGRLQHPGIAQIYEAGVARGRPFFAMERIHGHALLEYAAAHRLTTPQRLNLIIRICEATQHAHDRGIIHRDLKPGNILVDETGQPKILDFGVARVTDGDAKITRGTDLGKLVGTLAYMSPEQVRADPAELDARSDVYALGLILYELLAGRMPYESGRHVTEAVHVISEQEPYPLGSVSREFRGDLQTIAAKALEKDKSRRYPSAADFAADLRRHLGDQPILAQPPGTLYLARKFGRRHRVLVRAAAAVLLILIAGIAVSALRAEQVSKAVNDFLQNDLLSQAGARAQAATNHSPDPDLKVRTALDRAAARITGKFDSQPLVEAAIRRTIGLAYFDLNLYADAQTQLERAVELRKAVLGPQDPDTVASMDDLGVLYNLQGKYAAAEAMLIKVSAASQRALGSNHKDTLAAMSDLALAISYQGDDARAAPLFEKVLETSRRVQGEEHPATLSVTDDLGTVYLRLGKYARAEALLEREVELNRRVLGPEHPDTPNSMHNLASAYRLQGKYAQSDPLYAAVLTARLRALGEEHWQTQNTRFCLGLSYRAQGRYAEARPLLTQAVQALVRVLGAEHPLTLQAMYHLAELDRQQRRFAQAESLFRQLLEARRRVLGNDNPYTAQALASLGELKLEQRAYADAEKFLREAVQAREKQSPDTWERWHAQAMLGAALAGLGRRSEAAPLLASAHDALLQKKDSIPAERLPILEEVRNWKSQFQ